MKKIYLIAILSIALFSCKKEVHTTSERTIEYNVKCNDCTLVVLAKLDQTTNHAVTGELTKTYKTTSGYYSEIELKTNRTDLTSYIFTIKIDGVVKKSVGGYILNTNAFKSADWID